jgi:hypothetical protein
MKTMCPMCRQKAFALHTDKLVRALALEVKWPESGVCLDCYNVLAAHRLLAFEDHRPLKVKAEVVR